MDRAMIRTVGRTVAGMLLLAGCSDSSTSPPDAAYAEPGIAWHECPADVAITLTTEHRCGTLSVPVDHQDSSGASLALEVLEVWPTAGNDGGEVALSVGFNFGEARQPSGDMALLAERLGVPVVALAPRGVGEEGGTALDCPDVGDLDASALDHPDAVAGDRFVQAVTSCREQLRSAGTDPALFGTDDIAADLEALRAALGLEQWYLLISYGEMSRVTDAYVARHGDRVRAVVKDSPAPSSPATSAHPGDGLRSALQALLVECADDPVCARRYPDLEASWQRALARVASQPLSGVASGVPVLIDAPKFLRVVRSVLGSEPAILTDLPRIITVAADGQVHPTLATAITIDPDYCIGHRPTCTRTDFSLGAYLSQACPDLSARDVTEEDPLFRAVFVDSPYAAACEVWGVEATHPPATQTPPTLVLTGGLDSWSRPEWFPDAINVRGVGHDVASVSQCVLEIRNPWIADPTRAPDPRPCESDPSLTWD